MSATQDSGLVAQFENDHNVDTVDDFDELGPAEACWWSTCYDTTIIE